MIDLSPYQQEVRDELAEEYASVEVAGYTAPLPSVLMRAFDVGPDEEGRIEAPPTVIRVVPPEPIAERGGWDR